MIFRSDRCGTLFVADGYGNRRVDIKGGAPIGYLSRDDAVGYHAVLLRKIFQPRSPAVAGTSDTPIDQLP